MIEQYLVSKLGTIAELNGQFYPTAAPVGDDDPPFCIYTRVSGDIQRDLAGNPVFYRDVFRLELFGGDADILFALEKTLIDHLTENNIDAEALYIFSANAGPGGADAFDLTMALHMRSILYTVTYWR